ncbi:hypothetical protein BDV95DRAFT_16070 [Massariosphaeria phaeospora]|uniref:Uncharacterized protein n=1 Tax=Massariosphaeria phaeospora TaxID=100035 RepID=A0A7C8IJY8_9PLEO|nr:hypothetical protein BDV95DRAFT_16070 [Massariosphaeria phaeospora]
MDMWWLLRHATHLRTVISSFRCLVAWLFLSAVDISRHFGAAAVAADRSSTNQVGKFAFLSLMMRFPLDGGHKPFSASRLLEDPKEQIGPSPSIRVDGPDTGPLEEAKRWSREEGSCCLSMS